MSREGQKGLFSPSGLEAFLDRAGPKCIITGCGLRKGPAWSWGNLFEWGGLWIFHGASHATQWLSYDAALREGPLALKGGEKALILEPDATYFERRGVWVIAKTHTWLNEKAQQYLNPEGE